MESRGSAKESSTDDHDVVTVCQGLPSPARAVASLADISACLPTYAGALYHSAQASSFAEAPAITKQTMAITSGTGRRGVRFSLRPINGGERERIAVENLLDGRAHPAGSFP